MAGGIFVSAGTNAFRTVGDLQTNPAATTTLLDTGDLAAGAYILSFLLTASAASRVLLRHRNAADSGDIWTFQIDIPADQTIPIYLTKDSVADGESYEVEAVTGPGAAETIRAALWGFNVG